MIDKLTPVINELQKLTQEGLSQGLPEGFIINLYWSGCQLVEESCHDAESDIEIEEWFPFEGDSDEDRLGASHRQFASKAGAITARFLSEFDLSLFELSACLSWEILRILRGLGPGGWNCPEYKRPRRR